MPDLNPIAANLASIHARIGAAARKAGRDPAAITLVAVSKTHDENAVRAALQAGQFTFGENRPQEATAKFPALLDEYPDARLHLIGPLQTNKVRDAVTLAHMIESLDRPKLSDAIAKSADATGRCPNLLVQINIGDEPQKAGIATNQADAFIRACQQRFGDRLQGIMCIPPADANPTPYFQSTIAIANAHGLKIRSMGMSSDFETAIAEGATHIRIGAAIFGTRPRFDPSLIRPGGLCPPGPPSKG